MNEKVFNDLKAPLYTISQIVVAQCLVGNSFMVSSGILSSGGTSQQMAMQLSNPSGSGIRAVIDFIEISVNTSTLALMTAIIDGTASGLSSVTPFNLNTDYLAKSPTCTVSAGGGSGVSLSGGKTIYSQFLDVYDRHYPFSVVVTPGHSFGMNYTFSSSGNQGTFMFRWYEIPLSGMTS